MTQLDLQGKQIIDNKENRVVSIYLINITSDRNILTEENDLIFVFKTLLDFYRNSKLEK